MAKILKCPRCQGTMDVTGVAGGSTVRCPDCGQMARVPSGVTSMSVKTVSAPTKAPTPPPRMASGRGTKVRTRQGSGGQSQAPPPPKSSSGLFIGLGIGAVAVIAVVAFFLMRENPEPPPPAAPPPMAKGGSKVTTFNPTLPASSDKPLVLGSGKKDDPKPTVIAKPADSVENANWDQLMQQLRPGGGFEHDDRPEGVAFKRVKGFGKAAYPKLIKYIDDEDTAIGAAAVSVLNALTGRSEPTPRGANKARIKAEWQAWLDGGGEAPKPDAPKPDAPKQ